MLKYFVPSLNIIVSVFVVEYGWMVHFYLRSICLCLFCEDRMESKYYFQFVIYELYNVFDCNTLTAALQLTHPV